MNAGTQSPGHGELRPLRPARREATTLPAGRKVAPDASFLSFSGFFLTEQDDRSDYCSVTKSGGAHDELLRQGIRLFTTQGYGSTGVQQIVEAARVPKGSFYNHFESKDAFAAEAVRMYADEFSRELDVSLRKVGPQNAIKQLRAFFEQMTRRFEVSKFREGCLVGSLSLEGPNLSKNCRQAMAAAFRDWTPAFRELIERGQQEGRIRKDIPAPIQADFVLNAWQGSVIRMKIEGSAQPLEQFSKTVSVYLSVGRG